MNKTPSSLDYTEIGLKCGLEIHQQLDTAKLFCRCPSLIKDDVPEIKIRRILRARAGETGEIDVAAMHEMEKEKEFLYEGCRENTCLIDFDEEPPLSINEEALTVALQAAALLNAKIVDEIHVMRKTVVDGSNTSGFQRTALVGLNGFMQLGEKKITIPTIAIEEEAARKISADDTTVTYRLDRLGIPLVEIATGPELYSPQEAKAAAEYLGMILRSTEKVKRGIGTIRQDVNVSIKGGTRIEIKGAQDLKGIPFLVEYEARRQIALLAIKKELEERKAKKEEQSIIEVTDLFAKTQSSIIKKALEKKGVVSAIKISFFQGLLGTELQPGKRLGTECSERAKSIAGVGGIFHSDEDLTNYGITQEEITLIKKKLAIEKEDAFVLVADSQEKANKALCAVSKRIEQCFEGVPKEVRKANEDYTTSFLRPMPGAARMYPETDIPPIKPTKEHIHLPELITEKTDRLQELGLQEEVASAIAKSGRTEQFCMFTKTYVNVKPAFIAEVYTSIEKVLRRKYNKEVNISNEIFGKVFAALNEGKIAKEVVEQIFTEYVDTKNIAIEKYAFFSDDQIKECIQQMKEKNPDASKDKLFGFVMTKVRGKADPKKIKELLE